eukprot:5850609-Pleurochrysis_carterae.AAC.3
MAPLPARIRLQQRARRRQAGPARRAQDKSTTQAESVLTLRLETSCIFTHALVGRAEGHTRREGTQLDMYSLDVGSVDT